MLEQLAEICTGITREEMAQPVFSGLSVLNYPELHEESISQLNSFRAVSKMMEICGIQDFSMKDFMAPSAKRLRRQLSGIINFAKFREERLVLLSDLNSTREVLLERMNKLKDQNETLNNRLALLRETTAEEAKIIAKVETECKEIETQISDLNCQQAEIKEECSNLKSLNNDLKDSLSDYSLQFEENTALKKKLSAQIVNSPERFRKQIIDVGQALQMEQKDAKAAERKLRDLTAWLTNVDEAQVEVDSALESINELRAEVERQKAVIGESEMRKQEINGKRVALEELDQNLHQLSRQSTRSEDKLQTFRRLTANRGADSQKAIEELHKQLIDAENFRMQIRARAERVEGESQRLEREMEAEGLLQEQEREDMVASYQRLEKHVISHLHTFRKALEEVGPANTA
jgi:kinetochore protein Nuf2